MSSLRAPSLLTPPGFGKPWLKPDPWIGTNRTPGPTGESTILTVQTPASEDPAGGQERMVGNQFTSAFDGTVVRGRWYVGAIATSSAVTALWQLWSVSGPTKLAEIDVQALGDPTTNDWIEFDVPDVAITAGTQYVVTRFTDDNYAFNYTDPGGFPISNGPLTATTGRFLNNNTANDFPTGTTTALFFADVVVNYGAAGGGTVNIDGSLGIAVGSTAAAQVDKPIDCSLTVTTGLTAAASVTKPVDGSLTVTTILVSAAEKSKDIFGSLTVAFGGTSAASVTKPVDASLVVTANRTAALGATDKPVTASLTITANRTAAAQAVKSIDGSLTVTANRTSTATVVKPIDGSLTVVFNGTADADLQGSLNAAASLTVTTALTAAAAVDKPISGTLSVSANRTADAERVKVISGSLTITESATTAAQTSKTVAAALTVTVGTSGVGQAVKSVLGALGINAAIDVQLDAINVALLPDYITFRGNNTYTITTDTETYVVTVVPDVLTSSQTLDVFTVIREDEQI